MTQEKGIPYQRHRPSAALETFLEPLEPGVFFDCGRARLHGLDDALVREAISRGRTPGDDSFQLIAAESGLIFCRASISFAIAAPWDRITVGRPSGDDPVVLPVMWPVHGELAFTVSKRLAGNLFRRWVQLQARSMEGEAGGGDDPYAVPPPIDVEPDEPDPDVDGEAGAGIDPEVTVDPVVPSEPGGDRTPSRVGLPERTDLMAMNAFINTIDDQGMSAMLARSGSTDDDGPATVTRRRTVVEPPAPPRGPLVPPPARRPEPPVIRSAPVLQQGPTTAEEAPVAPGGTGYPAPNHRSADVRRRSGPTGKVVPRTAPPIGRPDGRSRKRLPSKTARPDTTLFDPTVFDPSQPGVPTDRSGVGDVARTTGGVVSPSWVGSPVSLLIMMLLVSATVFTAATVVSLNRGAGDRAVGPVVDLGNGAGNGRPQGGAVDEEPVSPTTIDHRRLTRPMTDDQRPWNLPFGDPEVRVPTTPAPSDEEVAGPDPRPGPLRCNSNYSGCIPDVDDVDCPGEGDGPVFASEPAVVLGDDVYRLDEDGDGRICE